MIKLWLLGTCALAGASCTAAKPVTKPVDAEACHSAIVAIGGQRSLPQTSNLSETFDSASQSFENVAKRFASMDTISCTEEQIVSIGLWRDHAARVAAAAQAAALVEKQRISAPGNHPKSEMNAFLSELDNYEARLCVARLELKAQLEKQGKSTNHTQFSCTPFSRSPGG